MDYKKAYAEWLAAPLTEELKAQLAAIARNDDEIKDAFYGDLEFRTAGMRGIIGVGPARMNYLTVNRATKGLAGYILSLGREYAERGVVIAYDTRRYSFEFALSAAGVLSKNGVKAFLFDDVRPVPVGSFAIRRLNAAAGIIITASHNPKEYNGYKVYGDDGAQMSPEATDKVVGYIAKAGYFDVGSADVGGITKNGIKGRDGLKIDKNITVIGKSVDDAYYSEILKLTLSPDAVKAVGKDVKLVYTPLHGSGYVPVTTILKAIGINASVVDAQKDPDFDFSTVSAPNPEQPDALKLGIELAKSIGASVVIGTDPDCDRMGAALKTDGGYTLLTGNQTGALLLDYILTRKTQTNTLPKNAAAVKTIVTTELAAKIAESYGCQIVDVLTGFKFIGEKIKEWEDGSHTFIFGYEESYGYLSGTHSRDKDAVVASMLFCEMVCYYQHIGVSVLERLDALYKKFGYFCEKNLSIAFSGADAMQKMSDAMTRLRKAKTDSFAGCSVAFTDDYLSGMRVLKNGEKRRIDLPESDVLYYGLEGGGFICARPSGTEPKLKLYVSVSRETPEAADAKADELLKSVKI
ncbi:MAG: phospho-sugar mutase [Clostridiales bacterium]|jgi:phosphoglucomutase|nr:phospho-sugar mutase [Clostridiales bacterium]